MIIKKIYLFLLLTIPAVSVFAQNSPSDKLFEKMSAKEGVTILTLSKQMLDAVNLNFDNDKTNSENNITGDLNRVKLIIYKAPDDAVPMNFHHETLKYLPGSRYKKVDPEYYNDDDGNENIDIRVLRSGKKIKECHIILEEDGTGILLSFFGDFMIDDVKKLAERSDNFRF